MHPSANIHYLLCTQCGKDPVVPKPVPVVAIRAMPLHPLPRAEVIPIKKVVFLTEAVTLIAKMEGSKKFFLCMTLYPAAHSPPTLTVPLIGHLRASRQKRSHCLQLVEMIIAVFRWLSL